MEKIDESTIRKVASLARLQLTDKEVVQVGEHLEKILRSFATIASIDTQGVEPMITPIDINHPWRGDVVQEGLSADIALEQAPAKSGNSFKVPPVV